MLVAPRLVAQMHTCVRGIDSVPMPTSLFLIQMKTLLTLFSTVRLQKCTMQLTLLTPTYSPHSYVPMNSTKTCTWLNMHVQACSQYLDLVCLLVTV